jgi:hypothetical protein
MEIQRSSNAKIIVEKIKWPENDPKDWISISMVRNYKGTWHRQKTFLLTLNEFEEIKKYEPSICVVQI